MTSVHLISSMTNSPDRICCLIAHERVLEIVDVVAVAVRTQVKVGTLSAAEKYSSDAGFLAAVADDVRMTDTDLCVVNNDQIVLSLVANAVICSMSGIPIHDDSLLRRMR